MRRSSPRRQEPSKRTVSHMPSWRWLFHTVLDSHGSARSSRRRRCSRGPESRSRWCIKTGTSRVWQFDLPLC